MGKSAKCIRMLQLLAARGSMSREELAWELHTNVRNITEYRRELEEAGYRIESTTGRYGGYQLMSTAYIPMLKLNMEEQKALLDAQGYLCAHADFLSMDTFTAAMDKIRVQLKHTNVDDIYMQEQLPHMEDAVRAWIRICEEAISSSLTVALEYKGAKDTNVKKLMIHPYEILHYQSAYYCLAYSLSAKDFRFFKFSRERMKHVSLMDRHFTRDRDFRVKDHVGALGIMKGDLHELEILISGYPALLAAEKEIGLQPQMRWQDEDTLYIKTVMEGKMNVISLLLSMGAHVKVLSPDYLKEELRAVICKMYEIYAEEEHL